MPRRDPANRWGCCRSMRCWSGESAAAATAAQRTAPARSSSRAGRQPSGTGLDRTRLVRIPLRAGWQLRGSWHLAHRCSSASAPPSASSAASPPAAGASSRGCGSGSGSSASAPGGGGPRPPRACSAAQRASSSAGTRAATRARSSSTSACARDTCGARQRLGARPPCETRRRRCCTAWRRCGRRHAWHACCATARRAADPGFACERQACRPGTQGLFLQAF